MKKVLLLFIYSIYVFAYPKCGQFDVSSFPTAFCCNDVCFSVGKLVNTNTFSSDYNAVNFDSSPEPDYVYFNYYSSTSTSYQKTYSLVSISSCPSDTDLNSTNGVCESSSCPSGQVLIDGKCQTPCKSFEFRKNGVCVSFCNPPFQYKYDNSLKKGFCVNSNFDKSTCISKGFFWYSPLRSDVDTFLYHLPSGCYSPDFKDYYYHKFSSAISQSVSYAIAPFVGVELSSSGLFLKFKRIFAGAKTLWYFIKDKFSSNNVNNFQDLSNQNIKIQDLKMSGDGVVPIIDLTPLEDLPDDVSWGVPSDTSDYSGLMPADDFDFSSLAQSPEVFDNLPAEIPEYTDNIIGTKNILDTSKDISSFLDSATEINTPVKAKIVISDSFDNPTQTKQFDLDTIKISEDNTGSYPITKYKATIKYPDNTVTSFDIVKTDMGKNGKTYDITTTTPLSNGDTFQKTYHIQKAQDGTITNTLQDPATMTKVNPDGSTDVVSNASPDTAISTKTGTSLVPITNGLKTIETKQDFTNQQLQKIDTRLKDMIDYVPPVNDDFDQSLKNFNNALTNYDINVSNFLGYLSNFKQSLQNLITNFDNAKKSLQNKPTFSQNTGTCGFTIHAFKQDYHVDPCMFVTPYRPILVVFFTLMGSFAVIIFAVKFLISKGAE